jgi:hypothetical protein
VVRARPQVQDAKTNHLLQHLLARAPNKHFLLNNMLTGTPNRTTVLNMLFDTWPLRWQCPSVTVLLTVSCLIGLITYLTVYLLAVLPNLAKQPDMWGVNINQYSQLYGQVCGSATNRQTAPRHNPEVQSRTSIFRALTWKTRSFRPLC